MKNIFTLFVMSWIFVVSFACADVAPNLELNRKLNSVQVVECESLAKKIVKKLRVQGLTGKQIIDAFADEIATNVDGEHDEKSFFTSKLTLIVGGVLVTGLAAFALYWLCKPTQNTGSTAGAGTQGIFSFAPGYQASPAERIAIDQLQQDLIRNRQNPSELTRLTDEFRHVYPVSVTGHIIYHMSWSEPIEVRDSDGNIIATGSRSYVRQQEF